MTSSTEDQKFVRESVPNDVMEVFKTQVKKLVTGERRRATLANSDNHFEPLDGLKDRLEEIHNSAVMKHAVESCDKDD